MFVASKWVDFTRAVGPSTALWREYVDRARFCNYSALEGREVNYSEADIWEEVV